MICTQRQLIEMTSSLVDLINDVAPPEELAARLQNLITDLKERELVIPVVGAFSAGKSTLINEFIGETKLLTGITPETSLATEIRYSPEDFIEAVRSDGGTDRYESSEMAEIKKKVADYKFARFYMNSPKVKGIAPLVLVDMPGFDSPCDAHHKAILAYLDRGCHYVVLSSVEEGTITRSLLRHLQELHAYNRDFAFFLSKTDLRSPQIVDELVTHYQDLIRESMDLDVKVMPVCKQNSVAMDGVMTEINPNTLFLRIYRDYLKDIIYQLIEALNLRVVAAQGDIKTGQTAIHEMQQSLDSLERKSKEMLSNIERQYSGVMVDDLLDAVGKELIASADELTEVAATGNSSELSKRISDTVIHTLMLAMKEKLGVLNRQILDDFSVELKRLDSLMSELFNVEEFSKDLAAKMQASFESFSRIGEHLGNLAKTEAAKKNLKNIYRSIVAIVSITTAVLAPLVEILILLLPDIIEFLLKGRKQAAIKDMLLKRVFPDVRRQLRANLPGILQEQIGLMIAAARDQYQESIQVKQAEIQKGIAEKELSEAAHQKKLLRYNQVRNELTMTATKLMEMV